MPLKNGGGQLWTDQPSYSVVSLEWASPGVGGGIVFPLSVSVGFALKLLLSDVLISVSGHVLNGDSGGGGNGNECEDGGVFHFTFFKIYYYFYYIKG